jgi:two-component system cell cycle sensor histidine kinase/response regulator CckA
MRSETGRFAPWCLDGKGTAGILIALGLLIVAGVAARLSSRNAGTAARRVVQSHEALHAIDGLRAALLDAESSQRGFLLSGDRAYLAACVTALPQAQERARKLRSLTSDNPEQQHRLDILEPLLARQFAALRAAIDPANGGIKPAAELPVQDANKQGLDDLRALLATIHDAELTALAERSRQSEAAGWWLGLTTMLANWLALGAAAGAIVLINRGAIRRRKVEEALRQHAHADRVEEGDVLRRAHSELQHTLVQAQDARQAADELVRGIFAAAPLAFVALDCAGRVCLWNPAAERAFGWAEPEIIGQPYPLVPPGKEAEFHELFDRALGGVTLVDVETQRRGKGGQPVEVGISAAPLCNPSGDVTGVLVVLADMTEGKALEAEVRRAQKLAAVGRLAGGIAHDFNNLLTVINCCCELMQQRLPATDPTRELLEDVRRAGERAAGLTRQLLAFGGRQVILPRLLDLNGLVAELGKLLGRLIGEDVALLTVLDPALGSVRGDRGQLEQVVMNLVLNARDAMPQGGTLTIDTRNVELTADDAGTHLGAQPGPYVRLTIRDTGTGMNATTQAHIFEPFFTTKAPGHGTGLGLATVYGIVKQSAGSIEVESAPGRGTTFRVFLPRVVEPAPAARGGATTAVVTGGTETVLVVEDERIVRRLICDVIRERGYTVVEAGDGVEALRCAEDHVGPIHLLITDLVMPRMSGRVLAEHLTALRPGMRVLFLSGHTADAMERHGVQDEETAFLQKPFAPDSLAAKVREVLVGPNVPRIARACG